MTEDEYDPDDALFEINRKLANVSITNFTFDSDYDTVDKSRLPEIKHFLCAAQPHERECFQSVQMLRKYLTQATSSNGSVDDILNLGVLPRLRELLVEHTQQNVQFEVAWIVTNIAAGTSKQTEMLVNHEFIPALLECLHQAASNVKTQRHKAAWALSNFAGESPRLRELLVQNDAIGAVAQVLMDVSSKAYEDAQAYGCYSEITAIYDDEVLTDIKALTWAISNMSRGGFYTADYWSKYLLAFDALSRCILFDHVDVWIDGGWGLSRILHNMHGVAPFYENFQFAPRLGERLAELLHENGKAVSIPILRTLINITSLPDSYCMRMIDRGLVRSLIPFMSPNVEAAIRKDTFLVLANLAACNEQFVEQCMLSESGLIHYLQEHIGVPGYIYVATTGEWTLTSKRKAGNMIEEWKITTDALWIVCNFLTACSADGVSALLSQFPELPRSLLKLTQYDLYSLPIQVAVKTVDAMVQLVLKIGQNNHNDLFVDSWKAFGLERTLQQLVEAHPNSKALNESCTELAQLISNKTAAAGGMAAAFGLTILRQRPAGASKRRVLHGFEDGDVRLIENAVGKLSI